MEIMDREINLIHYVQVIRKHRWSIAAVFTIVFVSVLIFTFTATPIYRATARVIIEKDDPKVVSIQEVMTVDSSGLDYYQTQFKIIESRGVAREVIRRLKLGENEEFVPKPKDTFLANIGRSISETIDSIQSLLKTEKPPAPGGEMAGESEEESPLVTVFIGRIKVIPIRNSRLVDIGFEAKDPALAAKIANNLARAYIDLNLETKLKATQDAMNWLNSRIEEERKKVETAEQALLRYKEQHNIITDFSKDVENITAQKLAALNAQVIEAEARRVEAETRYKQAVALQKTPEMLDSIPEVLNNDLIRQIKQMEVELYKRRSELSKKYGTNHPQIVAIENELMTLQSRKGEEVNRVINSLFNGFKVAQAREQSLKSSLDRQKGESFSLNSKAINYSVLKREAESTKEMYDLVIKRFKETSLTENIRTGNIRIVDPAEVPKSPVKPKQTQNMLLGLIVGLSLGIGLAFFLEYLDNTVKIPEDIKEHLKIPYLGPVPVFRAIVDENPGNPERRPQGDLVTLSSPKSTASEAYRGIRTSILFSAADTAPRAILVASAAPMEGKTVTASNLAITMVQAGNRVLIIDCDLRRPRLHRIFDVPRDRGISNILVGNCTIDEATVHAAIPRIDIIPSGPVPPNPSEMLGSQNMTHFMQTVRDRYDLIILDSPPITAVTDTVILSRLVDGVLLVIRAGETHREIIKNSINLLQAANARILGAILNGVEMGRDSYYYYQYYYYYYGEDGERQKKVHRKKRAQSSYHRGDKKEPPEGKAART
jgi:polysaccharide biosynthesis transport protein